MWWKVFEEWATKIYRYVSFLWQDTKWSVSCGRFVSLLRSLFVQTDSVFHKTGYFFAMSQTRMTANLRALQQQPAILLRNPSKLILQFHSLNCFWFDLIDQKRTVTALRKVDAFYITLGCGWEKCWHGWVQLNENFVDSDTEKSDDMDGGAAYSTNSDHSWTIINRLSIHFWSRLVACSGRQNVIVR